MALIHNLRDRLETADGRLASVAANLGFLWLFVGGVFIYLTLILTILETLGGTPFFNNPFLVALFSSMTLAPVVGAIVWGVGSVLRARGWHVSRQRWILVGVGVIATLNFLAELVRLGAV